jgi:molecular chaperone DnaK
MPQIEVTFDIDANGIVHVAAKDKATGKEQTITISGSSGLNKDEVDRMVKDAEAHATDDRARREAIDARNQVDALVYSVEKTLAESRSRLDAGLAGRVDAALEAARTAVKGDDKDAITKAGDALQQASHAMAEALYHAQQAGPSAGPSSPGGSDVKDAEVVDAEFAETR